MSHDKHRIETLAVHSGREPEPGDLGLAPALQPATTFLRNADGTDAEYPGGHQYSRSSNPTRTRLEHALATLEGGGKAFCFGSGMAAACGALALLRPGDHAVVSADAYYGVIRYVDTWLAPRGVRVTYCDMSNVDNLVKSLVSETRLVWLESPSNPELKITDLATVAELCTGRNIVTVCDATLASPLLQRTLDLGIDVVMHSSTKFIGGHHDLLGGVLVTRNDELAAQFGAWQSGAGAVPSAFDCWLMLRSLPTLPLRVGRQSESALKIARWLSEQSAVERVFYPGLEEHAGHDLAKRQMTGYGAVVSFLLHGNEARARALAARTHIFLQATSLGGVESLIEHRASIEGAQRRSAPNLLRLSIGLEHVDDLIADLALALDQ